MGTVLVLATVGVCAFAWRTYVAMDVGRTVYNHRPGVCRLVEGPVKGAEDIELIRPEGIAFITSGILYLQPHRATNFEGKMFLYNFTEKSGGQINAKELPIHGDSFDKANFHPHGLTHWVVNDVIRLYVINHNKDMEHSVEVFDYDPIEPSLLHKESIKDPTLVRPNDLVAVGADQFIFTNDGVFQGEWGNLFEVYTGYNGGTVYYWDGKARLHYFNHLMESHLLLSGMGGPNGIAYDSQKNKVFVADLRKKLVHAYDVAEDKLSLSLLSTIDVRSGCDNLYVATDGSLYTACHPVYIELAKSVGDCDGPTTSPSQVLRLQFDQEYKTATISEVYSNDGREHSASSVAVLHNNQMLIGSVCKGLLHCEIADPSVLSFQTVS